MRETAGRSLRRADGAPLRLARALRGPGRTVFFYLLELTAVFEHGAHRGVIVPGGGFRNGLLRVGKPARDDEIARCAPGIRIAFQRRHHALVKSLARVMAAFARGGEIAEFQAELVLDVALGLPNRLPRHPAPPFPGNVE